VFHLDSVAIDVVRDIEPRHAARRLLAALRDDVDRQAGDRGATLGQNVHDVDAGACCQGAQERIHRALTGHGVTIEHRRRAVGAPGLEALLSSPVGVYALNTFGYGCSSRNVGRASSR